MLTLPVGTMEDLERVLVPVVDLLLRGGLIAYPTDTLYGIAVDPTSAGAVARLLAVKGRPAGSPIPLIACDLVQVEEAGAMTDIGRRLAGRFWPGPLALVIRAAASIDSGIHQGSHTVAIRVPAHPVARALARAAMRPITATSANPSGHSPPSTADEVRAALADRLDALVDAGATPGGEPSTIVDVTSTEARLVREGAVPWDRVLKFLESARDT